MKKYTDKQLYKSQKRVQRIFSKFPKRIKKMIFDDDGNLYGERIENPGYFHKLNFAYYVILGKKIYVSSYYHDFTSCHTVTLYKNTIFYNNKIKIYDDNSNDHNNILEHIIGMYKWAKERG